MLSNIVEKIKKISAYLIRFFKANLTQLVLLFILFQLFFLIRDLPFINLINNLEFYALGLLLFLALVFFRVAIPNRRVVYIVLLLFVIASITTIGGFILMSEIIGFIIFTLLFFVVIRELIRNRKDLREEIDHK